MVVYMPVVVGSPAQQAFDACGTCACVTLALEVCAAPHTARDVLHTHDPATDNKHSALWTRPSWRTSVA